MIFRTNRMSCSLISKRPSIEACFAGFFLQDSSIWAAERGSSYVRFADFIDPRGEAFAALYQEHFQPSARLSESCVYIGMRVGHLRRNGRRSDAPSMSARMMLMSLFRGRSIPVPTVLQAEEFLAQEGVPAWTPPQGRRLLTGSPKNLRRAIETVAADYGAQEVFVVNILYDHQARLKSYRLLAEAFR